MYLLCLLHSLTNYPTFLSENVESLLAFASIQNVLKMCNFKHMRLNGRTGAQILNVLHSSVLPTIQHGQQILSTIEGIPVTLPCKASGIPKPSIIWSKVNALLVMFVKVTYYNSNI